MAKSHIDEANKTLLSIPPSIPKPPRAEENLLRALQIYNQAFYADILRGGWRPTDLQYAERFVTQMGEAKRRLFVDQKENVVKIADSVRAEASEWMRVHAPPAEKELRAKIAGLSSEWLFSVITILVAVLVLVPVVIYKISHRSGRLFSGRRGVSMRSLTLTSNIASIGAAVLFLRWSSSFSSLVGLYVIHLSQDVSLAYLLSALALVSFIGATVMTLLSFVRETRVRGLLLLVFMVMSFATITTVVILGGIGLVELSAVPKISPNN